MSEFMVFNSWQSDLPRKLTRDVIHKAAAAAIERLRLDATLEDSPRLDHDTQSVPGTPEIAGTIFTKIRDCGLFIADVSFIGETTSTDQNKQKKLLPNPNVMAELGYAAAKVGWDRIVLVLNIEHGPPDALPFDLKNRQFPISYRLGQNNRNKLEAVQASLANDLEDAIRSSLQAEHAAVDEVLATVDIHGIELLKNYGHNAAVEHGPRENMGQILGSQLQDAALIRLLEKKIVKCVYNHTHLKYVYEWTYFGKLVLTRLGVRNESRTKEPVVNLSNLSFSTTSFDV